MFRVARNLLLPQLSSTLQQEQEELRNEMIRNTWEIATKYQQINVHVLQELLHVASPQLVLKLIQPEGTEGNSERLDTTGNAEIMKDPLHLIQILPTEWIDHSSPDQDPYQW